MFLFKNTVSIKLQKIFNGFAAGIMFAASIWSLIIPSIEMEKSRGNIAWLPASIGIILGVASLLWIDSLVEKSMDKNNNLGQSKKNKMLNFAITLHNIPEGMAVRNCICFKFNWKLWNANYVCNGAFNRNCYTKYTRGNGNIVAN